MTTKQEHTSLHKIHYINFQTKIHICFRCHHVWQNRMMEPLSIKIIILKKKCFFLIIYLLEQVVSSMDEKKTHIKTEDLVIS